MIAVNNNETIIGFIGIGVMGKSMVSNLMADGYQVHIYTRTKGKAEDLLNQGAVWQDSPALIAKAADVIITMIGYPCD